MITRIFRLVFHNNYSSAFTTNLAVLALSLVASILLARYLGPTGRGEVAAAMLWSALLVSLGSLGMLEAILYFTAQPDHSTRALFGSGLAICLVQSALLIPVGYVTMPLLLASQTPEVVDISRLFLLVIPISLFTQYNRSILQGRMKIGSFNLIQVFMPAGYLLTTVALYALDRLTVRAVILWQLYLNLAVMVLSLGLLFAHRIPVGLDIHPPLIRRMLKYGLQVHIGTVFGNANLRLDQVLMAAWVSPTQLGLYVVAVSAASVSGVLARAVGVVATPAIARVADAQERVSLMQSVFRNYWLAGLVLKLGFALVLPWGVPLIYGAEYREAVLVAEVLLLASLFFDASHVLMSGTRALGAPWLASRTEIVASAVTVISLFTLLPLLGIIGAAIASLLAYATAFFMLVHGLRRRYSVSIKELFRIDKPARLFMRWVVRPAAPA